MRWGLGDAALGLAAAALLVGIVGAAPASPNPLSLEWRTSLSFLAAWLPLLGAVLIATFARGQRSLRLDFGLYFTWLDILYGFALGFVLRTMATLIEIAFYGRLSGGAITFGPINYDLWWILLAIVAPVLLAPLVEELYFRGLLQRAAERTFGRSFPPSSRVPLIIAVTVSSVFFAAVHMLQTDGGAQTAAVGLSTLLLGTALGTLAAITGRLGGAIIAHAVFNGLGVLGTLL